MGELTTLDLAKTRVQELEAKFERASEAEARKSAVLLMGAYPKREVNDPKVYVRMLSLAFQKYPADLHFPAIDRLTDELKFLPTKADVVEVFEKLLVARRHDLRSARIAKEGACRAITAAPPTEAEKEAVEGMVREVRKITASATLACSTR